jgi:hypothetical protein
LADPSLTISFADSEECMGPSATKPSRAARLDLLLARAVMPALLLAGLLALLVYHFGGTLTAMERQQSAYDSTIGFGDATTAITFHRDSGVGRPAVLFGGQDVLDYADAASTITVDGQTETLWSADHGYSSDTGKRQIFSTTTGAGWQVVAVATVAGHAVTISYAFVSSPRQGIGPQQVVLTIVHTHRAWLNPTFAPTSFSALALPEPAAGATNPQVTPHGTITLTVSGPNITAHAVTADPAHAGTSGGAAWVTRFTTTYEIDHPTPGALLPLGTETVTFQPESGAAPVPFPTEAP